MFTSFHVISWFSFLITIFSEEIAIDHGKMLSVAGLLAPTGGRKAAVNGKVWGFGGKEKGVW
jgi:hypothetical protein